MTNQQIVSNLKTILQRINDVALKRTEVRLNAYTHIFIYLN